ncbi:hypothetical protein J6590_015323 [Homalodisca vitripennis]|nr:hypothetical protein J6590_015323 [Homalodisca vitripennis]
MRVTHSRVCDSHARPHVRGISYTCLSVCPSVFQRYVLYRVSDWPRLLVKRMPQILLSSTQSRPNVGVLPVSAGYCPNLCRIRPHTLGLQGSSNNKTTQDTDSQFGSPKLTTDLTILMEVTPKMKLHVIVSGTRKITDPGTSRRSTARQIRPTRYHRGVILITTRPSVILKITTPVLPQSE